jgi:S-adenosylmethionine:tRNA ribosyltransferase-isomerase
LHFTPDLIQTLVQKGMQWEELTLQVGLGTFRPVKVDEILQHPMHEEYFYISDSLAHLIEQSKNRKPIVAIGTTTTRALESAAGEEISSSLMIKRGNQSTSIFIHPLRPRFRVIDHLLTNFHLPQSTLLMLVCAFAGYDLTMRAYEEAVREKYRFFSYGDAMLIV